MLQGTGFGNFLSKLNDMVAPVGIDAPAREAKKQENALYEDDDMMMGGPAKPKLVVPKKAAPAKPIAEDAPLVDSVLPRPVAASAPSGLRR
jgi:hypothetical protein